MRDFVVRDLDGHLFTLGRAEERLREVGAFSGLTAKEIKVDLDPPQRRRNQK